MFVRFRRRATRLELSLVETRRVDGRVRQEHIASLGALRDPPETADRVAFWRRLHERLGRLGNRLDGAAQGDILTAVHARVPMPTIDDARAVQLEHAKRHETMWRLGEVHTEGIVESNRALRDGAAKRVAEGEPLLAMASAELKAAENRRERIERGEDVPLPGKPPSRSALLKQLSITPARANYMTEFAAHDFNDADIEAFAEWQSRREGSVRRSRATLRAFLRSRS
jgi:hypothetical protein